MAGFLESALGAVSGLIEAGPVKIDNKLVEGLLGVAAVGVVGYTAYKVLNDKDAAENFATARGKLPSMPATNPEHGARAGTESETTTQLLRLLGMPELK